MTLLPPTSLSSGDTSCPVSGSGLSKTASPVLTRPSSDPHNTGTMLDRGDWRQLSPSYVAGFWCLRVTPVSSIPAVHGGDSCYDKRTPRTGRRTSENTVPPPIVVHILGCRGTDQPSLSFRMLEGLKGGKYEMVRPTGVEPVTS